MMVNIQSKITSFRANRFNVFQAAAALHYHRAHITAFLEHYVLKQNRKLQSVSADNLCDEVDCHVIALGILFYRVTGPYWELLAQDVHYLDFHIYVNKLLGLLQGWATGPDDAFNMAYQPLFEKVFMPDPPVFQTLLGIAEKT